MFSLEQIRLPPEIIAIQVDLNRQMEMQLGILKFHLPPPKWLSTDDMDWAIWIAANPVMAPRWLR